MMKMAMPSAADIEEKLAQLSDAEVRSHLQECQHLLAMKTIVTEKGEASAEFRAALDVDVKCCEVELKRRRSLQHDCCRAAFVTLFETRDKGELTLAKAGELCCEHMTVKGSEQAFVVFDVDPNGNQRHILGYSGGWY